MYEWKKYLASAEEFYDERVRHGVKYVLFPHDMPLLIYFYDVVLVNTLNCNCFSCL